MPQKLFIMYKANILIFFVFTMIFNMSATAFADALLQQPDIVVRVIDKQQGLVEIKNIGNMKSQPTQLYVNCTRKSEGDYKPCAAGLKLPNYIKKWNTLFYDVPALGKDESFRIKIFSANDLPWTPGYYGMKLTIDPLKKITESDETNNYSRLDVELKNTPNERSGEGQLQLSVSMAGKPIKAAILVTLRGKRDHVVLQTESRSSDSYRHMKQTPFTVSLAAGKYDLYVKAVVSPLNVYMQTKSLPIVINAGEKLDKAVVIPSGHLQLSSLVGGENSAGIQAQISGGGSYNGNPDFQSFTTYKQMTTPIDADIPPGKYRIKAWNPKTRQTQNINLVIKDNKLLKKSLVFHKFHGGYLNVNLLVDGKKIPSKDFYKYAAVTITSTSTLKEIKQISASHVQLPSGTYDVVIHEQAWGNPDIHLSGIKISDDKTIERNIELEPPGELQLISLWETTKLEAMGCSVVKPVANAVVIPLYFYLYMTGKHMDLNPGKDRAKCDPYVNPMIVTFTRLGKENIHSSEPSKVYSVDYRPMDTRIASIRLVPGSYNFKLWPLKHEELQQTLENIKIEPGKVILKKMTFVPPPDK